MLTDSRGKLVYFNTIKQSRDREALLKEFS